MAKRTTSIRFDEQTKRLAQEYPTSQYGVDFTYKVTEIIHIASNMRRHTLREIAGLFTENEAKLIVDVMNGTLYHSGVNPKSVLIAQVEDGCALDGLDEKWEVNKASLIEKLYRLTEHQAYVILSLAFEFWGSDELDLNNISKLFYCRGKDE